MGLVVSCVRSLDSGWVGYVGCRYFLPVCALCFHLLMILGNANVFHFSGAQLINVSLVLLVDLRDLCLTRGHEGTVDSF